MKISIKNLANIKRADEIEIKNFNVFIGKNGSGKTYFAKLIYFLTEAKYTLGLFNNFFEDKLDIHRENEIATIIFSIEEINDFFNESSKQIKKNFPTYIGLDKEIFKNFQCTFTTRRTEELSIDIDWKNLHKSFNNDDDLTNNYNAYIEVSFYNYLLNLQTHYLPAARANFMITYKYIIASILESKFPSNKDSLLDNVLPEIEMRFLMDIFQVNTKHYSPFASYATKIEKEIFKSGKLSIKNPKHQKLPTYQYKLNNTKHVLDLVAASSAITELSPLIMYLRHGVRFKNEMLIIDEPELSLHPEAQRKLIEILIECLNEGLKITLVTHSPYIIEALNSHLQRFKIDNMDLSENSKIKKFPVLNPDDVSAYLFQDNTIINILDEEVQLIDDRLLNSFNTINDIYNDMRDIEWEQQSHESEV